MPIKDATCGAQDTKQCLVLGYSVKNVNLYPQRPINVTVEQNGETSTIVRWELASLKASLEPDSYEVYVKSAGGDFQKISSDNVNADSCAAVVNGLIPGTQYTFMVKSCKRINNAPLTSEASEEKTFTIPGRDAFFKIICSEYENAVRLNAKAKLTAKGQLLSSSSGTFSYQWQHYDTQKCCWSDLVGENSTELISDAITSTTDSHIYRCVITMKSGDVKYKKYSELMKVIYSSSSKVKISFDATNLEEMTQNEQMPFSVTVSEDVVGASPITPTGAVEIYTLCSGVEKKIQTVQLTEQTTGTATANANLEFDEQQVGSLKVKYVPKNSSFQTTSSDWVDYKVGESLALRLFPGQDISSFTYGQKLSITANLSGEDTNINLTADDLDIQIKKDGNLVSTEDQYILDTAGSVYEVQVSYEYEENNYMATTGQLTCQKANLSVSARNLEFRQNEISASDISNKDIFSVTGLVNGDVLSASDLSLTTDYVNASPAGSYSLTPVVSNSWSKYSNYNIAVQPGILSVIDNMKFVNLSLANERVKENNLQQSISAAKITGDGASLVSQDDVKYMYFTDSECTKYTSSANGAVSTGSAPSAVGTYYVKCYLSTSDKVIGTTSNVATFTIEKKANSIDLTQPSHGTLSTNVSEAMVGSAVVVTVTPDEGYQLNGSLIATNPKNVDATQYAISDSQYVVIMPEGGLKLSCEMKKIELASIQLSSRDGLSIFQGEKGKLEAIPYPQTVSGGEATINISSLSNPSIRASYTVNVNSVVSVTGISLTNTKLTLTEGEETDLAANIAPATATNHRIEWKSSNQDVLSVNRVGHLVALAAGTSTITATTVDGNKVATCVVTVNKVVKTDTTYKITYVTNGGKQSGNPTTYTKSTASIKLKDAIRKKYKFLGWYSDSKCKNRVTQIAKGSTGNRTLYAKWKKISVAKAKIKKVTKKKALMITLKKLSGVSGYQIRYATNKKLKKPKTKTIKKLSLKVTGIKKKKKYYIKVRAYVIDSTGSKVYGKWSSLKKV